MSESELSAKDRFYSQYGKAMAAFADLEHALYRWFQLILEPDGDGEVNSDGIFYSARSFNGRADMLKAASASFRISDDQRKFVRKAIKRATDYNKFRAKLAHRTTIESRGFSDGSNGFALYEGDDHSGKNLNNLPIRETCLFNATTNVDALAWVIDLASFPSGQELQDCLLLIERFPKEPHLSVDNHLIEEIYAERQD